jgi:tetratricopeptide (TPR) repeat protein
MGDSYRDEGNTEVAQQWYNDAINFNFLESSPYEKFIGLCNDEIFFKASKEKIEGLLEKISQLEPDSSYTNILYNAYRSAGNTFFINNEIEQSEKYYRAAIKMHPGWITAYIDLGNVLASKELHEKAEAIFNEALKLDKDCFDLNWALATWNEQKENLPAAHKFYLECIKIRPRWTDYINNVIEELYINNDKGNELIAGYKSAVENEPSEENRISLAIGYEKLKKYDLAAEQYKDILKTESENAFVWNRLGNIYYDISDFTSAITSYQNAVKYDASTAVYFNNLGLAYRQTGDWNNSIDAYKKALQLNAGDNESMNAIGIAYYRMGNYEEARLWYAKAVETLKPENNEVQLATYLANIGLTFYDEGNTEKAIDYFTKAVDKDPNSDAALNYLGNAFFAQQNYEQARIYYNKAIQIQPENAVYLSNAGLTYYFQANYSKAIELFEQSLQYDAEYLPALNYGGNCYLLLHNYQEAESFYRKCISLNSSESFYYSNLGISLVKQNKFDEAGDNLNHAISLNEQNLEAVTYLGFIAYKKGDAETAKNYYNKAYPHQLQDPTLYYQLLDPENTTQEAQKNLEENPDDFMSLWQLGSVNYMNQDFDESKKYFRKALDLLFADESTISAAVENFKKIDKQQWNYSIGLLKELFKDDETLSKQLADIRKQVDV